MIIKLVFNNLESNVTLTIRIREKPYNSILCHFRPSTSYYVTSAPLIDMPPVSGYLFCAGAALTSYAIGHPQYHHEQ